VTCTDHTLARVDTENVALPTYGPRNLRSQLARAASQVGDALARLRVEEIEHGRGVLGRVDKVGVLCIVGSVVVGQGRGHGG
jgi:hypothetical protein